MCEGREGIIGLGTSVVVGIKEEEEECDVDDTGLELGLRG